MMDHGIDSKHEVKAILAHAYDEVRECGYRKGTRRNNTRDAVTERLLSGKQPSAEGLKQAEVICDWLTSLDQSQSAAGDLERICISLVRSGYADLDSIGHLSYMPLAYNRYWDQRLNQEAGTRSKHVGKEGEQIIIKVKSTLLLATLTGYHGMDWLYRIVDESGNVYTWFAAHNYDIESGSTIRARVKRHEEKDGVKRTVITRCKVM